MSRADELRAELAAAELEETFLEAKAAFEASEKTPEQREAYSAIKQTFHDARAAFREQRQAAAAEALAAQNGETPETGDATVTPAPVSVTARATDLGRNP